MTRQLSLLLPLVLACGCGPEAPAQRNSVELPEPSGPPLVQQAQRATRPVPAAGVRWESKDGTLRLLGVGGGAELILACRGVPARLVATAPSFTPIGSEDRFSLGLGEEPITLVADPTRQKAGGGVTAEGPVPGNLAALLSASPLIRALYGVQQVGPHPSPPRQAIDSFIETCS